MTGPVTPHIAYPGVYVVEQPTHPTIHAVPVGSVGFVGPCVRGPVVGPPSPLSSLSEFDSLFGTASEIAYADGTTALHHLRFAARSFFDNGGHTLFVSRACRSDTQAASAALHAAGTPADAHIVLASRSPGPEGNHSVLFREVATATPAGMLPLLPEGAVVRVTHAAGHRRLVYRSAAPGGWRDAQEQPFAPAADDAAYEVISVQMERPLPESAGSQTSTYALVPSAPDYIARQLASDAAFGPHAPPYALSLGAAVRPLQLVHALFGNTGTRQITLSGGTPGTPPTAADHDDAFARLALVQAIGLVATPGAAATSHASAIQAYTLDHVRNRMTFGFALLETPPGSSTADAIAQAGTTDSDRAALYWPWLQVPDPHEPTTVRTIGPVGAMAGVYCRVDRDRGVSYAPANVPLFGLESLAQIVDDAAQAPMNAAGVNALRTFPGRGTVPWGARTLSHHPDHRYIQVRRFSDHIQASVEAGLTFTVFEPNDDTLWASVRTVVSAFMDDLFRSGSLQGTTAAEAYFVQIGPQTTTAADIALGQAHLLVGFALLRPAEFLVLQIPLKTQPSAP